MRPESRTRARGAAARGAGFTLLELLLVMVIIGIIIAFILGAAVGGIRRAEERATQALIIKLDAGLSDRVDALLATRADFSYAHYYMAMVANSGFPATGGMNSVTPPATLPPYSPSYPSGQPYAPSITRAQVIARFDQMKAELPDVFVVQLADTNYPLNFAAVPYPGTPISFYSTLAANSPATGVPYGNYLLPLGAGVANDMGTGSLSSGPSFGSFGSISPGPIGPITPANTTTVVIGAPQSTGIFGASYTAAAGLYKSLVAAAVLNGAAAPSPINRGYDGVDNDGNGLVDDLPENGASVGTAVLGLLSRHTHKTARSEMLYALLVEGQGPFGSVFSREDFSDNEVKDTDGDGLPEFVDAWGEPIQFYRWPVFYTDDLQRGTNLYGTVYENREQYPIDPNQQLMNPAWWGLAPVAGSGTSIFNNATPYPAPPSPPSGTQCLSPPAYLFQSLFAPLTDPNATNAALPAGKLWDRGAGTARRAYFSKYLILSGGPDKAPGVPVLDLAYYNAVSGYINNSLGNGPFVGVGGQGLGAAPSIGSLTPGYTMFNIQCENQAAQGTPNRSDRIYMSPLTNATDADLTQAIQQAGTDDITSHAVLGPGGAVQ